MYQDFFKGNAKNKINRKGKENKTSTDDEYPSLPSVLIDVQGLLNCTVTRNN